MKTSLKIIALVLTLTLTMSMFTACSISDLATGLKGVMTNVSAIIISIKNSFLGNNTTTPNNPSPSDCEHIWYVATCAAPQTCSVCGATKGEALPHTEELDAAVAPSCTESGLTEGKHCSVCNTVTVPQEKIDPLGHTLTSEITKEPSCAEGGIIKFTCSVCDSSYEEDIAPTGHTFEVIVVEPTCTKGGYSLHVCSVCAYEFRDTFTDPTEENHEYDDGVVTLPAQCGVKGAMTYTCTIEGCGHTKVEDIAPLSHEYDETVVAPICTEYGYTLHTCKNGCGYSYIDTTVSPLGHDYEAIEIIAPSCDSMGYTVYECKNCQDSYKDKYTAPAHTFTSIITEPTCSEKGFVRHTCDLCGTIVVDSFTDIDPDNHDLVLSEDGSKEVCSYCGYVVYHSDVDFGTDAAGTLYAIPEGSDISEETISELQGTALTVDENGLINLSAGTYVLVYTEEGITKYRCIVISNELHEDPVDDIQNIIFINDLDELKAFRDTVNSGTSYAGYGVYLTADIDLNNEDWTCIGTSSAPFSGSFDGQGHTISNLYIAKTVANLADSNRQGLFGTIKASGATYFKNLTLHNANVTAGYHVGAVVGIIDGSSQNATDNYFVMTDIKLTGYVTVYGWEGVGGVNGSGNMAEISNIEVDVEEGSIVTTVPDGREDSFACVGSVKGGGYLSKADNIKSNLDVEAKMAGTGGLFGVVGGQTVDCYMSNLYYSGTVRLTETDTGLQKGYGCYCYNGLLVGSPRFTLIADQATCSSDGTLELHTQDGIMTSNDMGDVYTWGVDLFGASRDYTYTNKSYATAYTEN